MVKLYHRFLKSLKNFGLDTNVVTVFRPWCTKRIASCATRIASRERVVTYFWAVQQVLCCKQISLQDWIGSAKLFDHSKNRSNITEQHFWQHCKGTLLWMPKKLELSQVSLWPELYIHVHCSCSLPKGQAVKLTFFASWRVSFFRISFMPTTKTSY